MLTIARNKPITPLYCRWLWHSVTVLCDGTVTCGLDDPFKVRNYGNLNSAALRDILAAAAIASRRRALQSGIRCHACSMYTTADGKDSATLTPSHPYPKMLVLEPSIKCNIRCRNETCNIANDATIELRRENFMPWALFCKVIDEAGPHLEKLYFYNYGEPFLHPKALDMLAYAKKVNPKIQVFTSTNGILLAREGKAERIIAEELVDWICFTIGGVSQETYSRYHKAGSFEKAMLGLRRLVEEKRRVGRTKPIVHWRYLLFNWNDSDACIEEALRLREAIGTDEFKFMLTASPLEGRSLCRAPGTPGFEAIKPWLAYQDGYSSDPFAEAGLWGAENNWWLGPFSWTGRRASISVTPKNGRVNVRLARSNARLGPLPEVKIRSPWGQIAANVGLNRWRDNPIVVPRDFAPPTVQIELEVEKLFTPFRQGGSGDNRELGVMVSLVDISPTPNPYRVTQGSLDKIKGCSQGV